MDPRIRGDDKKGKDMSYILAIILGYLLGSIPFGLLLTRYAGLGDIRQIGSGNIGATNVLRTGRKGLAALTLILDGVKGAVAVLICEKLFPGSGALAGLAALIGHLFPVWLKGKGGKGVATTVGVMITLSWPVGLTIIAIWLLTAFFFRYSSLAAIVAIGLLPIYAVVFDRVDILWLTVVIVILVVAKHGDNIKRLLNKTETKIGNAHATPGAH